MKSASRKIIFVFLDGVGIGKKDPAINPFFATPQPFFTNVFGKVPSLRDASVSAKHSLLKPLNATLRVPGLPQSGTGQVALLTGINASKLLGKHFGPYPYSTLRPVLDEKNIFRALNEKGKSVSYVNAFPQKYFDFMKERPARMGAIAYSWKSSGFQLNGAEELKAGNAISANISGERWEMMGHPGITPISSRQAGERLVELSRGKAFTMFEYYFTDKAGHAQSFEEAAKVLTQVNDLLLGVVDSMDHTTTTLVVTSDHGNLEDLSTKSHTRNPVPLIAVGAGSTQLSRCRALTDVAPFLLEYLS